MILTCVRLVCASEPSLTALPHIVEQVDALCFIWTLEKASKRRFVSKSD